jgi:hypothetical protein
MESSYNRTCGTLMLVFMLAGLGQAQTVRAAEISVPEAIAKIRATHIIKPQTNLNLAFSKDEAVVHVERPEQENDNDCKIDGVFIAKALIDTYPAAVKNVRVIFAKSGLDAIEIPVNAAQLKDFASGKIDKQALLDFIPINKVVPDNRKGGGGFFQRFRPNNYQIQTRIESYEANGTDMSAFREQLRQLKGYQRDGNWQAASAIRRQLAQELHFDDQK